MLVKRRNKFDIRCKNIHSEQGWSNLWGTNKYYERGKAEDLDAEDTYEKKQQISKEKRNLNVLMKKYQIRDSLDPQKTIMTLGFNDRESASIKSFAVKKRMRQKLLCVSCLGNY